MPCHTMDANITLFYKVFFLLFFVLYAQKHRNAILVMFEVRAHDNTCISVLYEQESVENDLEPCELCTSIHHDKAFS